MNVCYNLQNIAYGTVYVQANTHLQSLCFYWIKHKGEEVLQMLQKRWFVLFCDTSSVY